MAMLLKAIYRFNAKLIKLSMALFTELNLKFFLKIYRNTKDPT